MNFQGFRPSSPPQFRPLNDENGARNVKQTLSGDRLICELERVIEKNEKEEEKKVPDDTIVDFIDKVPEILDYEYLVEQEKKQRELDGLKEEYNFDYIFEKIDYGEVPEQIEF